MIMNKKLNFFNFIVVMFIFIFLLIGCKPVNKVIVEHQYITHIVDSINVRDSIVFIPAETYKEISNKLDTLKMSTSLASAEAYLDTSNNLLCGKIWNNNTYTYEKEVIDHYIVKDSISYIEKPVPYEVLKEVPRPINKVTAIISVIFILMLLVLILRHFFF